jgi:L-ribulose-5-phosphate 3-epimerase
MRMSERVGVCSWSLAAADAAELTGRILATGVRAVQLALDPVRLRVMTVDDVHLELERAGIALVSGMMAMAGEDYSTLSSIRATGGVVPDGTWAENERAARVNAAIARELNIPLVTFHGGFVPEEGGHSGRTILLERLRRITEIFAEQDIRVALETGQESAQTLLALLDELGDHGIGVNFDPANMILYGMGDPVEALRQLGPRVVQVHIKDALPTSVPGEWGREVPVGDGAVDWPAFFATLRESAPASPLIIEREEGDDRVADIRRAATFVARFVEVNRA